MSYAAIIDRDFIKSQFLVKITPRIAVTGFAVYSGNVYSVSYSTPYVTRVGTKTVRKNSIAELTGNTHFYHDETAGVLYIYSSTAVSVNDSYVTHFELYFSTAAIAWYRDPLDTATDQREWDSNISEPPEITSSLGDQAFGIVTLDADGFEVIYSPEKYQYILSAASFKRCPVSVYHWVGELSVDNIERVFFGYLDERVEADFRSIRFGLVQRGFERYGALQTNIFVLGYAGGADPSINFSDTPMRGIFGSYGVSFTDGGSGNSIVAGSKPWNINYDDTTPTTSQNRYWLLGWDPNYGYQGTFDGESINPTVPSTSEPSGGTNAGCWAPFCINLGEDPSPAYPSTPNKYKSYQFEGTYASTFVRFHIGDHVRVRNTTTATNYYTTVTDKISTGGAGYDLKFDADVGSGDVIVTKFMVDELFLIQNDVRSTLLPVRDYSVAFRGTGNYGAQIEIQLTTSAESNVGASTIDPANGDYLVAIVKAAGNLTRVYESGMARGSNGRFGRIYWYLRATMGITQAEIDVASFDELIAADTEDTGTTAINGVGAYTIDDSLFTLGIQPVMSSDVPPNHTDVLNKMLVEARSCLFYGNDGLITIKKIGAGTSVGTIELDDIFADSVSFSYDFTDIDNVIYAVPEAEEVGLLGSATSFVAEEPYSSYLSIQDPDDGGADAELHDIQNPRRVVEKPSTLRSTRKGTLILKTTLRLASENVGSTITVRSKYLPGYVYDGETYHEADYVISEIKKGIDGVTVVLNI